MIGIRQRKQQERFGSSCPYPFLSLFFGTGTKRSSGQEGTNYSCGELFCAHHPFPRAILRLCQREWSWKTPHRLGFLNRFLIFSHSLHSCFVFCCLHCIAFRKAELGPKSKPLHLLSTNSFCPGKDINNKIINSIFNI